MHTQSDGLLTNGLHHWVIQGLNVSIRVAGWAKKIARIFRSGVSGVQLPHRCEKNMGKTQDLGGGDSIS